MNLTNYHWLQQCRRRKQRSSRSRKVKEKTEHYEEESEQKWDERVTLMEVVATILKLATKETGADLLNA